MRRKVHRHEGRGAITGCWTRSLLPLKQYDSDMSSASAVSLQFQRTRRHRKWLWLAFWSAVLLAIGLAVHSVLFGPTSPSSGLIGVLLGLVDLAACCGVPVCLMCAFIAWIRRPQNDLKDLVRLAPALSREWAEALLAEHGPTLKSLGLDPVVVVAHHAAAGGDPERISARVSRFVTTRGLPAEIARLVPTTARPGINDLVARFESELVDVDQSRSQWIALFVQALESEAAGAGSAAELVQEQLKRDREKRETLERLRIVGSAAWHGAALDKQVRLAYESGGKYAEMEQRLRSRIRELEEQRKRDREKRETLERLRSAGSAVGSATWFSTTLEKEVRLAYESGGDYAEMEQRLRSRIQALEEQRETLVRLHDVARAAWSGRAQDIVLDDEVRRVYESGGEYSDMEDRLRKRIRQREEELERAAEFDRRAVRYGGPRFVSAVDYHQVMVGMTTAAVTDALGRPGEIKRQATQEKWYFKPYESSRGQTKYRLEVTVKDGLVTAVKDL
jgi:hypothetical protein